MDSERFWGLEHESSHLYYKNFYPLSLLLNPKANILALKLVLIGSLEVLKAGRSLISIQK